MKAKRFLIYVDCINIILLYLIVISAYNLLFQSGMELNVGAFEYITIGAAFIYFYFVREYIGNLFVYFLANAAALAAVFFLAPDFHSRLRSVAFILICLILNAYYWMNDRASSAMEIHWGLGTELIAVALVAAYFDCDELVTRTFYFAVAFIVLQALKVLFENTYELLISGQMTDDMPVKEILRNDYLFAGIVVTISVLLMVFVRADGLIHYLRSFAYLIIKGFMRVVAAILKVMNDLFELDNGQMTTMGDAAPEIEEVGVLGQVWETVSALLILLVLIVVGFYIIRGFISFFKNYIRRDRIKHSTKTIESRNEIHERLERVEKTRGTGSIFRRTNSEKIRYIYKKKMQSYIKKGNEIKGTNTPVENKDALLQKGGPDIGKMTVLYEKARYSGTEASAEDVAAMKECSRGV